MNDEHINIQSPSPQEPLSFIINLDKFHDVGIKDVQVTIKGKTHVITLDRIEAFIEWMM